MPQVNIRILEGATREQKTELFRRATNMLVEVLDKRPEDIHVIVEDIPYENWGWNGQSVADLMAPAQVSD